MKKVLIITQLAYSPTRIQGLSKYLPKYNWEPIILTARTEIEQIAEMKLQGLRIIETGGYVSTYGKKRLSSKKYSKVRPYLKAVYKYYKEIRYYPDEEKKWKSFALKEAERLLQNEKIDAIISSSSPVTSHIIACELHKRYRIPWVADFRDLWTQNHNYPYSRLRRMFEERLELKTLSTADALVTVSWLLAEKLKMLHKGKNVYSITNGFDPEKMSDEKVELTKDFTITYTGQIYVKQDPSKLLVALKDLFFAETLDQKDVNVRFYGPENELLAEKIEECGLSAVARQYGVVPRDVSLQKQRESQLLLLLTFEDEREKGLYSGKIFEYLAAKRPILVTGGFGNDVVETLIHETNSGIYCSKAGDIKKTLGELYSEYKSYGKVNYKGNVEQISKYSYREIARKFAEILDNLSERRQSP
jgi:hypothetical protein